jgi:hypothetical protein
MNITELTTMLTTGKIGVFSGYMVLAGWRALSQKRPDSGDSANAADYAAASLMLVVALGTIGLGIR